MDHYLSGDNDKRNKPKSEHSSRANNSKSRVESEKNLTLVEEKEEVLSPNKDPYLRDEKTRLYKHFDWKVSVIMVLALIGNTVILVASQAGASASIRSSLDPDGIELELSGACTNNADEQILVAGSEALEETATYLGGLLGQCSGGALCIEDQVVQRFSLTNECASCMPAYSECLFSTCDAVCNPSSFDKQLCIDCSNLNCEANFEACTGVNFIPDNLVDACINEKDDLVFLPGSEALTQSSNYMSPIGLDCFESDNQVSCVKLTLIERFDISEDCSTCLLNHLENCMAASCQTECIPVVTDNCDTCLVANCASDLETCSGLDFFPGRMLQTSEDACVNAQDDSIFVIGSAALDPDIFLPPIGIDCSSDPASAEACVKDALSSQFGFTEDCNQCMFQHLQCISQFCVQNCFGQVECEACIIASPCEVPFESCTGINFYAPGEGSCVNPFDNDVFIEGSEALDPDIFLPPVALTCRNEANPEACVKSELTTAFGFTDDCSQCMFEHIGCLSQFCAPACFGDGGDCEACLLDSPCEVPFENCTGINFYAEGNGACVNALDNNIFVPGSEALNPEVFLPPIGVTCSNEDDLETCIKDELNTQFSFTENCDQCMFEHLLCISNICLQECFGGDGCEGCIAGSICEEPVENCAGIDFYDSNATITPTTPIPTRSPIPIVEDACRNPTDEGAIFDSTGNGLSPDEYIPAAAISCNQADDRESCVKATLEEEFGFTEACNECMFGHISCIARVCTADCFSTQGDCEACLTGSECEQPFETCTGIDFYGSNLTFSPTSSEEDDDALVFSDSGRCLDKDQFEIFESLELTFFRSIQKTIEGGSFALALLIGVASGIWPYTKNFLILWAWFGNLSQRRRDIMLRALSILGKWSLVDVFAVVLIVDGALLQFILERTGRPFVIFAEPRPGIYLFGIAALWALLQGEIIRYFEKTRLRQRNIAEGGSVVGDPVEKEKWNTIYKGFLGVFSAISLVFSIIGIFLVNLKMTVTGKISDINEGPSEYSYNTFQLAAALVDSCAIHSEHGSKAGAWFLAFLFLLVVVFIPILTCILLYIVAMRFHPSKADNWFISFSFGLSNFAALDVWFISLFVFSNQFEGLIAGALGENANNCPITQEELDNGITCVGLRGETKAGGWILLVAAVTFWFAQYAATRLMANSFHFIGTYIEYNSSL